MTEPKTPRVSNYRDQTLLTIKVLLLVGGTFGVLALLDMAVVR